MENTQRVFLCPASYTIQSPYFHTTFMKAYMHVLELQMHVNTFSVIKKSILLNSNWIFHYLGIKVMRHQISNSAQYLNIRLTSDIERHCIEGRTNVENLTSDVYQQITSNKNSAVSSLFIILSDLQCSVFSIQRHPFVQILSTILISKWI